MRCTYCVRRLALDDRCEFAKLSKTKILKQIAAVGTAHKFCVINFLLKVPFTLSYIYIYLIISKYLFIDLAPYQYGLYAKADADAYAYICCVCRTIKLVQTVFAILIACD
jgi:hypothetical protein